MAIDREIEKNAQVWKKLIANEGLTPEDLVALKYGTLEDISRVAARLGILEDPSSLLQAREDFLVYNDVFPQRTENESERKQPEKLQRERPHQQHLHRPEEAEENQEERTGEQAVTFEKTPETIMENGPSVATTTTFTRRPPASQIRYAPRRRGLIDRTNRVTWHTRGLRKKSPVNKLKRSAEKKIAIGALTTVLTILSPILLVLIVFIVVISSIIKGPSNPYSASLGIPGVGTPVTTPPPDGGGGGGTKPSLEEFKKSFTVYLCSGTGDYDDRSCGSGNSSSEHVNLAYSLFSIPLQSPTYKTLFLKKPVRVFFRPALPPINGKCRITGGANYPGQPYSRVNLWGYDTCRFGSVDFWIKLRQITHESGHAIAGMNPALYNAYKAARNSLISSTDRSCYERLPGGDGYYVISYAQRFRIIGGGAESESFAESIGNTLVCGAGKEPLPCSARLGFARPIPNWPITCKNTYDWITQGVYGGITDFGPLKP